MNQHAVPIWRADIRLLLLAAVSMGLLLGCSDAPLDAPPGGADQPLRVMLVPAFGGTEAGTKAISQPLFDAVSKSTGLQFDLSVGSSYPAVVEAMANGQVDIALFGAVSFMQAKQRAGAELLAVAVDHGNAVYHSVILVRNDSDIHTIEDLRGKSVALGDSSSTSSFNYPVAMMLDAGINPIEDLGKVVISDSHAASMGELAKGNVDAACTNKLNFQRAIAEGILAKEEFRIAAISEGIPNPPLAMHPNLPDDVKQKLRDGFHTLHEHPDIEPEMIRGEGNKVYERYDATFPEERFLESMQRLQRVTPDLKQAILARAQDS